MTIFRPFFKENAKKSAYPQTGRSSTFAGGGKQPAFDTFMDLFFLGRGEPAGVVGKIGKVGRGAYEGHFGAVQCVGRSIGD